MNRVRTAKRMLGGVLVCAIAVGALAQTPSTQTAAVPPPPPGKSLASSVGVLAYPTKGQTPAQQQQDESECYSWARTQSGFDPLSPPPAQAAQPAQSAQSSQPGHSAVRGAAGGALIGGVAGNAGAGAAAGATAGAVAGRRQRRAEEQQQQQQAANAEQAQAAQNELRNKFKSGMSLCLQSRGYGVK
jgi:hypothetical protein